MIELRDVDKHYRNGKVSHQVLHGITLAVDEGELLAIVGTSGSGKSTLLNLIGGLDADYEGQVVVAGRDLAEMNDRRLSAFRNQTIGFVFQQFNLLEHLTCGENVSMPQVFAKDPLPDVRERAGWALERVGLAERHDDLAANLSGGQKQRVAIARALFNRPRILLCDEPTGNLDSETGRQIINLFRQLHGEGMTMIIVTHEERVSSAAGRVVRLEDGRLLEGDGASTGGPAEEG